MKRKVFNALGIIIAGSSVFLLNDRYFAGFHLLVIFALGCIVYSLGDIIEGINKINKP